MDFTISLQNKQSGVKFIVIKTKKLLLKMKLQIIFFRGKVSDVFEWMVYSGEI